MDITVLKSLQALTSVERQQQHSHMVADDIPPAAIDTLATSQTQMPVLNDYFFNNSSVSIRKHNRFADYPLHTHQFFEINYMLRGSADEVVDGQPLHLDQGDVLLLDIGSQHAIKALGADDLMINVLFRDRNLSLDLLTQLQAQKSVFYDFLLNHADTTQQRHLLFQAKQTAQPEIQTILEALICEYYQQRDFADTIIQAQLTILIALLVRHYPTTAQQLSPSELLAMQMLDEIRSHYQKLTLNDLAAEFAYNKNYLSNLFTKVVGKPFSVALTEERLLRAHDLIQNTQTPITEICTAVGIRNKSFFYHKYAEKYGHAPRFDRQNAANSSFIDQL
ncbi:AraC family transcriptional regulator [Lacticaseibacillus porcinae]|uniref:AraC family transcriptional regulator n=1 Tax=Lacticaseibacillus porcinae TaxID=1123687 RepID=UPI000F7BA2B6|nr:helix-turn-helix domain-containing protein [Lacticaseibacillus porcinae]